MANLFDDANAPETEPATIVAVMSVGEAAEAVGKGLADYAERSLAGRCVNQGAPATTFTEYLYVLCYCRGLN